jgi:hypothetical protein
MSKSTTSSDEPPVSPGTSPKKGGCRVSFAPQSEPEKLFNALVEYDGFPSDGTKVSITPNGSHLLVGLHSGDQRVWNRYGRPSGDSPEPLPAPSTADRLSGLLAREDLPPDYRAALEALRQNGANDSVPGVRSVFELRSVFEKPEPIEYLIELELPKHSVTYLAGASESGKSTLACAWGRDMLRAGSGVLLLDRDRNPRPVILDRFERLGIVATMTFWCGMPANLTISHSPTIPA